jgi:hypothetical protein
MRNLAAHNRRLLLPCAACLQGRDSLFDNVRSCDVDPRSIAQRVMDIRKQLAEEFIQELQMIAEENALLLRWAWHCDDVEFSVFL